MKSRIYAQTILLFVLAAACGKESNKKKNDAPTNNGGPEKQCQEQGGTIENSQCKLPQPTGPNAEQNCVDRGADFTWIDGSCVEVPNIKLTGELNPNPGLIWEANTTTCDKVVTVEGDRYTNCAGIEAMLPLATVLNGKSKITLDMTFNCEALAPGSVELTFDIGADASDAPQMRTMVTHQSFGSGESVLHWTTDAEAGTHPVIKFKLAPTNYLEPYKAGCKIELMENSAKLAPF